MPTEIPAGRRPLVANEHLFIGRQHRGRHHWSILDGVAACGRCGKIRRGETMPARRKPVAR